MSTLHAAAALPTPILPKLPIMHPNWDGGVSELPVITIPSMVLHASGNAVKVYAQIANHHAVGHHPTRRELADMLGFAKTSNVDPYIKELVELGFMTVVGSGGRRRNVYTLLGE